MMLDKIKYIVNLIIIALLLGAVAINKDGRIIGQPLNCSEAVETIQHDNETTLEDGTRVINSSALGKDVIGYGGKTPIKLYIVDNIIKKVEPLGNSETPSFFRDVQKSGLFEKWQGMELSQAAVTELDAVSGATYSSVAVIKNVQLAAAYGASVDQNGNKLFTGLDLKSILGIVVILLGAIITLFKARNKILITLQLLLNVGVLGFWCGSFLSLTQFVSWISNGFNLAMGLLAIILLAIVIIMPLLGRKGSYCHIHCPMGSAQELLSKVPTKKWKLTPQTNKILNNLRYYILISLLLLMWVGVGFELIDYEVFSAFLLGSASTVVLVMGGLFLVLSLFIKRPYCRFICPTGALLTMAERTKQ